MSDLTNRLRSWSLTPHLAHDVQEAADRIEALEAALREIVAVIHDYDIAPVLAQVDGIARAALAPEQDK